MHITGKISEESHNFLITKRNNVLNGKLKTSFRHTQMDVNMSTGVNTPMDGRSRNIIHRTTKCILVGKENNAKNHIVLTTIQNRIKDNQ
jgi:hypothetical protein